MTLGNVPREPKLGDFWVGIANLFRFCFNLRMAIILPPLLEQKLTGNKNLRAAVDGTVADFDAWLRDSKLPFFTDYMSFPLLL
jgi:hypothetical protein